MGKKKQNTPSKKPTKSEPSTPSANNSTQNKDTKKYYRFRKEVSRLINKYYGTEISESEMKDYETKLIEYAADRDYNIYVKVACYDLSDYFELTSEDLLRFAEKPRAGINIEQLRLYTMANDALRNHYHEVVEPDEYGIIHDFPEVLKTFRVSTKMFRIKEEDLIILEEAFERDYPLDLKVKHGKAQENLKLDNGLEEKEKTTLLDDLLKDIQYKPGDNLFIKKADYWIISYESKAIPLEVRGNKGLQYIAYLLDNPRNIFDAHLLVREIEKMQPPKKENLNKGGLIDDGLKISKFGNVKTKAGGYKNEKKYNSNELKEQLKESEKQANDECKKIFAEQKKLKEKLIDLEDIKEIKEEEGHVDENTDEKIAEIKEKIFTLTKILAADGKGEIADIEKARSAVKNTINNSLDKLKKLHPSLWEHLNSNIKRGTFCSYAPAKPISWEVEL